MSYLPRLPLCLALFGVLTLGVMAAAPVPAPLSSRISLNDDWKFARFGAMPDGGTSGEPAALQSSGFDDSWWGTVTLPHDWAIAGPFRAELPGETGKLPWVGIGWYRKSLYVPASDAGLRTYLDIDGAMAQPKIYVNGQLAGEWAYGYSSFRVDLTPFLKVGAQNLIAIRLDNPANSSRWYPGGGLYRNVWLVKLPQLHFAHWGISIQTPVATSASATVEVKAELENLSQTQGRLSVRHEIIRVGGRNERPVASADTPLTVVEAGRTVVVQSRLQLTRPELWSPENPDLYQLRSTLLLDGKTPLDVQTNTFGVRKVEFTAANGFLLNGGRIAIQGVCEHHDLGPLGAAINTSALERKLKILKEMGVNAIRTSHNPAAPELLDLCDRMGILVLEEAFDCWKQAKCANDYSRHFQAWHARDLANMVRRDRNHPCIVLWSIGNEIPEQGIAGGAELAAKLRDIVRSHDDTRQVTAGLNIAGAVKNGFAKGLDVIGINYKPHLYGEDRADAPGVPIVGTETSSTVSSRGVYYFPVLDDPTAGFGNFQISSYDLYYPYWAQTPEMEWAGQDKNRFVAGEFVWTGFDYLGEPTPFSGDKSILLNYQNAEERKKAEAMLDKLSGNMPSRSSYFGIVDLAGFPKDRYYLYQARWRPDLPVAHLLPHWTWPGREGQVTPVFVYSNGDEAELFLNGNSLGRRKKAPGEYRFRWNSVVYQPGELSVTVYKNGRRWAKDAVKTAGEPCAAEVSVDNRTIKGDGKDLVFVSVQILDETKEPVPTSSNRINFFVDGPGQVIAVCNGDATSFAPFNTTSIAAFNGKAMAIVRANKGAEGKLRVIVRGTRIPEESTDIRIEN